MTGRVPLLLATRSPGKLRELRPMFESAGVAVIDLIDAGIPEAPIETAVEAFDTFEANACAKAHYFAALTGMTAVADDSGLEVAALEGAPGVNSKRWSGRADLTGEALDRENNRLLLARLVGAKDRRARFVCVACLVGDGRQHTARGEVRGVITAEARGSDGFGYDSCFVPIEGDGRTFAEMERGEKSRLSHRGRAFASLLSRIAEAAGRS